MTVEGAVLDIDAASLREGAKTPARRAPMIWFEVEDVIRHFDFSLTPSGIQRVCHEILATATRDHKDRVRVCRLSFYSRQFEAIDLPTVHTALTQPLARHGPFVPLLLPGSWAKKLKGILPALGSRARWLWQFLGQISRDFCLGRRHQRVFDLQLSPGDIIVCLGLPCLSGGHNHGIGAAKARMGVKYALLIHDLICVTERAIANPFAARRFGKWLNGAIVQADLLLTVSSHSRDALIRYAGETGLTLPPVEVLSMGNGFEADWRSGNERDHKLPEDYVLFVSTIEIRKNHALLFRIWRKLIDRHGADAVPHLVFVGTIGWLVDELLAELKASQFLGGKIRIVSGLSDAALREAYRRCRFTVFPSLSEGWGLPVAESLAQGKFCIASNRASLPEVGGEFTDYIDPSDETVALATVERAIYEPGYVAGREAAIKDRYRPASWADCTNDLIAKLDAL